MDKAKLILGLLIALTLTACEKIGDKESPAISEVYASVVHYHPSFADRNAQASADTVLATQLELRISDPTGIPDLKELEAINATTGQNVEIVNRNPGEGMGSNYDTANNLYSILIPSSIAHRIDLDDAWRIRALDMQGYVETRSFNYRVFDGDPVTTEEFEYSDVSYIGVDTANGIAAMEVMTIADNALSLTEDTNTQSFDLSFQATDLRAKNYIVWFYNAAGARVYALDSRDQPVEDNPITIGQATNLTIPWSVLDADTPSSVAVVAGAYIALLDDAVQSSLGTNMLWFYQTGVSEYVPVN